jgi:hypothetical protein
MSISTEVFLSHPGPCSKFESKKELYLYFSLDTILKKHLKQKFLQIKEYRHQHAVENFEFQILYFNKYTQTYRHYFQPSHVATQTEDIEVFEAQSTRLANLASLLTTKRQLFLKSAFMTVVIQAKNNHFACIDKEVNEKQRMINRKLEWATINEKKKVDAQAKFFLIFLLSFYDRKVQQDKLETFDKIEHCNYKMKLRAIAMRNMVAMGTKAVATEFERFRKCCHTEREALRYEHADFMKGLFLLKCSMKGLAEQIVKTSFNKVRLETRPRSRRSIIGMTRPSLNPSKEERNNTDKRRLN